jgi:hypothetical protein
MAGEALLDIKFRRQSRILFANALKTTRSTFARFAKGGSASPLARRSLGEGGRKRCD